MRSADSSRGFTESRSLILGGRMFFVSDLLTRIVARRVLVFDGRIFDPDC